ncbi:hypothetical protein ACFO25_05330 [Paenactinomyces guangxiensis]|uniref:DUF1186 domain-containing protein n=1 Tax=Paenactinomyces guangxiensis TaxID=1490290 RepID=A0A7W2A8M5_9BACL|nr:hypothetical protein [Paenactinomyces guangxiensis]MBA4494344.1 hypothetical protein [Paenactinomyces guangxiensis]MBH8590839.1 hypothetical protein [Paenactinomyces guangxiensis]
MLQVTRDLIQLVHSGEKKFHKIDFSLSFIGNYGEVEDAEALLDLYLEKPDGMYGIELLEVIQQIGNLHTAQRLFKHAVEGKRVRRGYYGNIFNCLAYLGYKPVESILYHLLEQEDELDVDQCLALLHFPCTGYEKRIRRKILQYKDKNLFPEFLPILACRVPDPDLPDILYEWGTKWASPDCNGGLILGLSLYGEQERERFKKILWDRRWEAHGRSTGSIYWTILGMQYLGMTFDELYEDIRKAQETGCNPEDLDYRVWVLEELLEFRITTATPPPLRFVQPFLETYEDLYDMFFDYSNDHYEHSIIEWVDRNVEDKEYLDFRGLKKLLLSRMEQEFWKKYLR